MSTWDRRTFLGQGVMTIGAAAVLPSQGGADARFEMIDTLRASGPHIVPGEDPQARIFDTFVGAWDIQYSTIHDDDSKEQGAGQLLVGWILEGHALQDIWIWNEPGNAARSMGTTIRFFDPTRKTWRVVWTTPFALAVTMLEGGGDSRRIVLEGDGGPRGRLRWSFNDIAANDFNWRGEVSADGGKTWRLRENHHMRRVAPRGA